MFIKTEWKYSKASRLYDFLETPVEAGLFQRLRASAIPMAEGNVLEVGIGTGKNLPYYGDDIELVGIDFSKGMLEKAKKKKEELKMENVTLKKMDVQNLDFKDSSFDTALSTFVFCTVPDPLMGLKNIYRVLKPDGKAIFIEHMRSRHLLINVMLFLMNIMSKILLGTSMIRDTRKNITDAGFKIIDEKKHVFDVIRIIVAQK